MSPNGNGDRKLLLMLFGLTLIAACSLQAILHWDGRVPRVLTVEMAVEASKKERDADAARWRLMDIAGTAIGELKRASAAGDSYAKHYLIHLGTLLR
jgi:hypothetical protein